MALLISLAATLVSAGISGKKDTSMLSPPVSGTVGTLKLRKLNKQGMVISTRHEVTVVRRSWLLSITALSL